MEQENTRKYFVYRYRFPNGKVYIGQSFIGTVRYGKVSSYKGMLVYKAMLKYPDFKKEIVQYCLPEEIDYWEQYWIAFHHSMDRRYGYNLNSGGSFNKVLSEESKKKLSDSAKARHQVPHGGEKCRFKKGLTPWNAGKKGLTHHTEEWKKAMSEHMKSIDEPWLHSHESMVKACATKKANGFKPSHTFPKGHVPANKGIHTGIPSPRARKVRCIETGVVYPSVDSVACGIYHEINGSHLTEHLKGKRKQFRTLHWEYAS